MSGLGEIKDFLLTEAEIEEAAEAFFSSDSLNCHYVESRGHWELIVPTICHAQVQKVLRLCRETQEGRH